MLSEWRRALLRCTIPTSRRRRFGDKGALISMRSHRPGASRAERSEAGKGEGVEGLLAAALLLFVFLGLPAAWIRGGTVTLTRWRVALAAWSLLVAWWMATRDPGTPLLYLLVVWVIGLGVLALVRTVVRA